DRSPLLEEPGGPLWGEADQAEVIVALLKTKEGIIARTLVPVPDGDGPGALGGLRIRAQDVCLGVVGSAPCRAGAAWQPEGCHGEFLPRPAAQGVVAAPGILAPVLAPRPDEGHLQVDQRLSPDVKVGVEPREALPHLQAPVEGEVLQVDAVESLAYPA